MTDARKFYAPNSNRCPKCRSALIGRASEWFLGHCEKCGMNVVIRLVREEDRGLRVSLLEAHVEYLKRRVDELEGDR